MLAANVRNRTSVMMIGGVKKVVFSWYSIGSVASEVVFPWNTWLLSRELSVLGYIVRVSFWNLRD